MSEDLTPIHMRCTLTMSCPSVHRMEDGRLQITGELDRVICHDFADDEATIIIPPDLLDTFVEEKTGSLRERIKELEEALRPFASWFDSIQEDEAIAGAMGLQRIWEDGDDLESTRHAGSARFGDIRRARAALGTTPVSSADETEPARSAEPAPHHITVWDNHGIVTTSDGKQYSLSEVFPTPEADRNAESGTEG